MLTVLPKCHYATSYTHGAISLESVEQSERLNEDNFFVEKKGVDNPQSMPEIGQVQRRNKNMRPRERYYR